MQLLYKQACCRCWFFTPASQTSCFRKSETVPSAKWWAFSRLVFCFCPSWKMLHLGTLSEGSIRFGIVLCFRRGFDHAYRNHANFRDLKGTCATCNMITFFTFIVHDHHRQPCACVRIKWEGPLSGCSPSYFVHTGQSNRIWAGNELRLTWSLLLN